MNVVCRMFLVGGMVSLALVLDAQALPMTTVTALDNAVQESSGLIRGHQAGHWWTHNDSGGEPELYEIDGNGDVVRTVRLLGVDNVDWEEVTADDAGQVFVGDFGNNGNDRQDLVIYRLPHPDLLTSDSVAPDAIHFSYADQVAFPPADSLLRYDLEAMVAWGDSLFLFSKNRTDPFDGYTRLYVLPAQPGTYVVQVRDSFYTGPGPYQSYWVCGAALSPDREHLLLVSYGRGWLFSCFAGHDFFGGAAKELTWSLSQKEGAVWAGNDTLYLTDERINGMFGGNLYRALMARYTAEPDASLGPDTTYYGTAISIYAAPQLGASYLWSTGDTGDSLLVSSSGSYSVTVTAPNGCTASDTIDVQVLAGAAEPLAAGVRVTLLRGRGDSAALRVQADVAGEYDWLLLTVDGQRLFQGRLSLASGQAGAIALPASLPAGAYVLQCTGPGGQARLKFVLD